MSETEQSPYYDIFLKLIKELKLRVAKEQSAQLTTPPGIKFWTTDSGIVLGLLFNKDKQMLTYDKFNDIYEVRNASGLGFPSPQESLPLTPCKYEDLVPGDFCSVRDTVGVAEIRMVLPVKDSRHRRVKIIVNEDVSVEWGKFEDDTVGKIG